MSLGGLSDYQIADYGYLPQQNPRGRRKPGFHPLPRPRLKRGPKKLVCWLCLCLTAVLCFYVPPW